MNIKNLISQTAIYGISAILSKFLNYLLTPYLTRILAPEVYGEVSLLYGLIPFLNALLTMGMATAYFRWAARAETLGERQTIFTTLWGAVSGFAVLFFVVCLLFRNPLAEVMGYQHDPWLLVMTAVLVMIDNVAAIPLAAVRQQGRATRYTLVNVTSVVVNIMACWALYTFVPGAISSPRWVIVANIVASAVSFVILFVSVRPLIVRRMSMVLLKTVTRYSLPLMLAGIMGVGSDFLDRQMIRWMLPEEIAFQQLGIYGAVAKIAALMIIFRQIYTLGAEPFFLQKFDKEDFKRINAAALKFFYIAGMAVVLTITLFEEQFALIIGREYRQGMDVVPIMLIANLLMGVLVNLSFWYKMVDKTRYAAYMTVAGLATVVSVGYLLIPTYGYHGAAYAHLAAAAVMVVISYALNQAKYPIPYPIARIGFYTLVAGVIYGLNILMDNNLNATLAIFVKISLLLSFGLLAMSIEKINPRKLWRKK